MINVNFIPEEYIANNESRRTNFMYLSLLLIVIIALTAVYVTLSVQYRRSVEKEKFLNIQMSQKKKEIRQVEELQEKRNAMWKTALTTANLIEPVSKSVILASLTNNLPETVSLVKLGILQKQIEKAPVATTVNKNKYQQELAKKQAEKQKTDKPAVSPEKTMETQISIEGISPSDLEVAHYIENLIGSNLLENISLVESKEYKILNTTFRQFKLAAKVRDDIHLDDGKIENIKFKQEETKITKNFN